MTRHRRPLVIAAAVLTVAALSAALAPQARASAPLLSSGAAAHSSGSETGTASPQATMKMTGSLNKLVDPVISPIVNQDLQPLLDAVNKTVRSLASLMSPKADTDAGDVQVASAPPAWPNNTVPSPCPTGAHCYSAGSTSGSVASGTTGLASVSMGGLTGYVEQVQQSADPTNPVLGRASGSGVSVSALQAAGLASLASPVVLAAAAKSAANCPNDFASGASKPTTAPTANTQATGVSVLGGLVTFDAANGWPTNLHVNGVSLPDTVDNKGNTVPGVLSLTKQTVNGVTIARFGQGVVLTIPLTVHQVLTGLGLPAAVVSALETFTPKSTMKLSISVASAATVTSRTAEAWGLGVGVDLSGTLTFNLLGLVTATVTVPTGIAGTNNGNLLDLRLAYSRCTSGNGGTTTPPAVPAIPLAPV
jgi:hypothetical protein